MRFKNEDLERILRCKSGTNVKRQAWILSCQHMGQQVSRRVLWPRKGNIFSSNEKKMTLKIYFKKAGCVGYHHLDEKRKEFQSNSIVNNNK